MKGWVVCLDPQGAEEHTFPRTNEGQQHPPWVEVDDVAYYYDDVDGDDLIYRRPS